MEYLIDTDWSIDYLNGRRRVIERVVRLAPEGIGFGRERARLRAEGNLIGDFDLLIGASALRHGLTVLTNNRRHFQRIRGLDIEST